MKNTSVNDMTAADVNVTSTTTSTIRLVSDDVILYVTHISTITMFVFAVIGIIGNVINMVVFSKLGFRDSINISLFCLSLSDFLVSLFSLFNAIGTNPALATIQFSLDLPEVVIAFGVIPRLIFYKITKTITAFVTFERCLCVVMPLKIKLFVTVTRVQVLMASIVIFIFLSHAVMFEAQSLGWRFDPHLNRTIFTRLIDGDSIKRLQIFFPVQAGIFSLFLYPFIIICTAVLIINLQRKAAWREKTSTTGTDKTSGISQKDTKVAKMVAMVAGAFLVCGIPDVGLVFGMSTNVEFTVFGKYKDIFISVLAISGLFLCLNSAVNVFIYYLNSSNYRQMFTRLYIRDNKGK